VGRGSGSSVLEVPDAVATVTGSPVQHEVVDRRPGDPAHVVGAVDRIARDLGWTAKRDLVDMVRSAWEADVAYRRATPPADPGTERRAQA